jgi:hypothetical protein
MMVEYDVMELTVVEVVKDVEVVVTSVKVTIEVETDIVRETDSVTGIVIVIVPIWRVIVFG